jgi:hypothetical protein
MNEQTVARRTTNAARPEEPQDRPWRCGVPNCGTLLAHINAAGTEIRIKSRDVYGWFGLPAYARIVCRRCGTLNELRDPEHAANQLPASTPDIQSPP